VTARHSAGLSMTPHGVMAVSTRTRSAIFISVGAQWELWCLLARTDQTLGHHDASARAHVRRRVPPGDRPLGCFSNQNWQQSFGVEVVDTER
jgi:hypothetical protein